MKPATLKLAIVVGGKVLIVDKEIANTPAAIADIETHCAAMHAKTDRYVHFQLRDPADGRAVLVMEHGATRFAPMKGRV